MNRTALSKYRRSARQRVDKISHLVSELLQERQVLVAGWVRLNRRRCGRPDQCRVCSSGERHENLSFGARHQGRYIHRGIRPDQVEWLQGATERWRQFHRRRSALAKECQALLHELDHIKEGLCVDWQHAVGAGAEESSDGKQVN